MESIVIDDLDRSLLHALAIDGRASFSTLGEVLGVSDQTVARRYRRLRGAGMIRVVGLPDSNALPVHRWWLRLTCAPGAALGIAEALARRTDTSWIQLVSGGTEVLCATRTEDLADREALLLDKLPRTGRIIAVTSHSMLHMYQGGATGFAPYAKLSPEQIAQLTPPAPSRDPVPLEDRDRPLLDALAVDGRASYADLAAATGWSETTVRRRLEQLRNSGAVYFDIEMEHVPFGFQVQAWLWLAVAPSELARTGEAIAGFPETAFAAATTGPTNLAASVVCRDSAELYRVITERIGAFPAVQRLETAPIIRTVKQSGPFLPGALPRR